MFSHHSGMNQQEESWKIYKYEETKQCISKLMGKKKINT